MNPSYDSICAHIAGLYRELEENVRLDESERIISFSSREGEVKLISQSVSYLNALFDVRRILLDMRRYIPSNYAARIFDRVEERTGELLDQVERAAHDERGVRKSILLDLHSAIRHALLSVRIAIDIRRAQNALEGLSEALQSPQLPSPVA